MKIGIIGCGVISNTYIQEIKRLYSGLLTIAGVADIDDNLSRQTAEKYGIAEALTIDELLSHPEIELIINLTPPLAHMDTNRKILKAGKHLFSEKPFTLEVSQARELIDLAESKGLKIGVAPDTFLAAPMQNCRRLLEEGWIGKPLYVTVNMMSNGVETWHPEPAAFYRKGSGPLYEMAPYYLTTLVHLFGPVEEVFAYSAKAFDKRLIYSQPLAGSYVDVDIPTHYTMALRMKNGILVNMNMSYDVWYSSLPIMEIYGTEGTITMPDANMTDGQPRIFRKEQILAEFYGMPEETKSFEMPPRGQIVSAYTRGTGVAELALSIQKGRKNRTNAEMAMHIVDVINKTVESSQCHKPCRTETECDQPMAWDWTEECQGGTKI